MANQTPVTSVQSSPASINKLSVFSNKDKSRTVELANGNRIVSLSYYESILQDCVRATVSYVDTGNAIEDKTAIEGLPIVGTERVNLKFRDNNDKFLNLTLYVNKVTPVSDDTNKSLVHLDLVSREFIFNEKIRINQRFDGRISDHVRKILTNQNSGGLNTQKKIDIEETSNTYNFIGNNKKPYYLINWLSRLSVSSENQKRGESAGYFFFETSEGFKLKSIDGLLSQKQKKSISYNDSSDREEVPAGYDIKALALSKDNRVDTKDKLEKGAFSTRTILFDPFNCYYEVVASDAKSKEQNLKLAGKELPKLNSEFDVAGLNKEFSRTTYYLLDTGTLPTGNTRQQIGKSQEVNFDVKNILNQSIMRYNQLYSSMITVTIAGDFSLHAGDVVYVDVPELSADTKNDQVSKQSGGLYIISDLCHYVTTKGTFTKLNLVRDSFGRTGNHTTNRS